MHFTVRPADLAALLVMVRDGVVSHSAAKQIFARWSRRAIGRPTIAERDGLLKVSDDASLARWIDEVLARIPGRGRALRRRRARLQGVLVGHVMKKSKGSADPKRVNQLLAARTRSVERRREVGARSRSDVAGMPKCRSASSWRRCSPSRAALFDAPASPSAALRRPTGRG